MSAFLRARIDLGFQRRDLQQIRQGEQSDGAGNPGEAADQLGDVVRGLARRRDHASSQGRPVLSAPARAVQSKAHATFDTGRPSIRLFVSNTTATFDSAGRTDRRVLVQAVFNAAGAGVDAGRLIRAALVVGAFVVLFLTVVASLAPRASAPAGATALTVATVP